MREFARAFPFFGFVLLILAIAAATTWRATRVRPLLINVFLLYTLVASFVPGLVQREAWPFSIWPLVAANHPEYALLPRAMVIDRSGREHDVDYRAWRPLIAEELMGWMRERMLTLDRRVQDQAAEHLLGLVERAIDDVRRGEAPGQRGRVLGPLSAPSFLLHPALWRTAADVPSGPLTGLRLYIERWDLEERLRDPSAVQRTLLYEYRRP